MPWNYIDTVERNIALFLKDKPNQMNLRLEHAKADFELFWDRIGAQGDLEGSLAEWDTCHVASTWS